MVTRDYLESRRASLAQERAPYEKGWVSVARFAATSRSRWLGGGGKNAEDRIDNSRLLDSHGVEAIRTLSNGMTSGLSSSSRPWFALKFKNKDLSENAEAKAWLSDTQERMLQFLQGTNFYGAMRAGYAELGLFGHEACMMEEHWRVGAVCHSMTAGESYIGLNDASEPDTLLRRFMLSAGQIQQKFKNGVAPEVAEALKSGQRERQYEVYHLIEPNVRHIEGGDVMSKAFTSVYWIPEIQRGEGVIRHGGYHEQPFWAPRWEVVGGETYGTSPAREALADLRELQMQVKRRNEMIDALAKPEKIVKAGVRLTGMAGNIVSYSNPSEMLSHIPYVPQYQAVQMVSEVIQGLYRKVNSITYADLFNAITNMQGIQPRNVEEIASRNEEKLTQLGPVIERVGKEKLKVSLERTYGIMSRGGLLAPPPQISNEGGAEIEIEFTSMLAQMQRLVGVGQIERTISFIGNLAGALPEVLDKIDGDAMVDEYAGRTGLPPHLIRPTKDAQKIRQQRAEQQQQQEMAAMAPAMQQGAEAARLLSETDTGNGNSLLQQVMGGM